MSLLSRELGNIKNPEVNRATLKRIMSNVEKSNIFQQIIFRPEEACTEKFSTDTDAAQIQVLRTIPNKRGARTLGAVRNGSYFNSGAATMPETQAYGINILDVIDNNIDISENQQGMMNIDLVRAELDNLYGKVSQNINAMTLAAQIGKSIQKGIPNKIVLDARPSGADLYAAMVDAGAKLDDGNEDEGIEEYPRENRAFFFRSTFRAKLIAEKAIILDSNYGQMMVKTGALDPDTKLEKIIGFVGEVDGTPCYVVSPSVWHLTEKYLGLKQGALDKVEGVLVCGIQTGRGLAFNKETKMIDAPDGQGTRIQPKFRFGAECWDAKSVVPILANDFVAPTVGVGDELVVAPESRTYTVLYDGNGNSGGAAPVDGTTYGYGDAITMAAVGNLVKSGYTFKGWNTNADGSGTFYAAGSAAFCDANYTFYAVWEQD